MHIEISGILLFSVYLVVRLIASRDEWTEYDDDTAAQSANGNIEINWGNWNWNLGGKLKIS